MRNHNEITTNQHSNAEEEGEEEEHAIASFTLRNDDLPPGMEDLVPKSVKSLGVEAKKSLPNNNTSTTPTTCYEYVPPKFQIYRDHDDSDLVLYSGGGSGGRHRHHIHNHHNIINDDGDQEELSVEYHTPEDAASGFFSEEELGLCAKQITPTSTSSTERHDDHFSALGGANDDDIEARSNEDCNCGTAVVAGVPIHYHDNYDNDRPLCSKRTTFCCIKVGTVIMCLGLLGIILFVGGFVGNDQDAASKSNKANSASVGDTSGGNNDSNMLYIPSMTPTTAPTNEIPPGQQSKPSYNPGSGGGAGENNGSDNNNTNAPTLAPTASQKENTGSTPAPASPAPQQPTTPTTTTTTATPSLLPTRHPMSPRLSPIPTQSPTPPPTRWPALVPTPSPTRRPTLVPTTPSPTRWPALVPTTPFPTRRPTLVPTPSPTRRPTLVPTTPFPTRRPTLVPTPSPTRRPTLVPTPSPTRRPTLVPTTPSPTALYQLYYSDSDSTNNFKGTAAGQRFGQSVALSQDGTVMAVASGTSSGANQGGQLQAYLWDADTRTWHPQGDPLTQSAGSSSPSTLVALSGSGLVMVAASANTQQVQAYSYNVDSNTWISRGQILTGSVVALNYDGTVLAVGNPAAVGNAGSVNVYTYTTSNNQWALSSTFVVSYKPSTGDRMGASLYLSGDGTTLAVGSPGGDGHVHVYRHTGASGSTSLVGHELSGSSGSQGLGVQVAYTDGVLAVLDQEGQAHFYRLNGGGNRWLSSFDTAAGHIYGSLQIFQEVGRTLVAVLSYATCNNGSVYCRGTTAGASGRVQLLEQIRTTSWTTVYDSLSVQDGGAFLNGYGMAVAAASSPSANTIVIGIPGDGTAEQGAVLVYRKNNM